MTYIEGFVAAVPTSNRETYIRHAAEAVPLFKEFGVARVVENWADDVPGGKVTDFRRAVQAREDEAVVFSWFEYPDRQARDAANEKLMTDPRMKDMGATMPFDGRRMIFGGFSAFLDEGVRGSMAYIDGYLVPVPAANKDAYREMAQKGAAVFREYGASRVVEAWGDDIPDGEVTDFRRAVQAQDGEIIVYSWIEWPSKEARDAAWPRLIEDERMKPDADGMPFDGKRMIYGGFVPLLDE
ncbi:MAG TPA: DUF1428 domain-containing protein [Woeseiaceae bacterium]|nr:DUF1428 domain-containing protein [Woeseiaceae bacterium]